MSRTTVAVRPGASGWEVSWEGGTWAPSAPPPVRLGGRAETIEEACLSLHMLDGEQLREVGRALWSGLGGTRAAPAGDLDLYAGVPHLLALPWHLLHDANCWLADRGTRLHVLPSTEVSVGFFSPAPSALLLAPSGAPLLDEWGKLLARFGSPGGARVCHTPRAALAALAGQDVVYLRVDGAAQARRDDHDHLDGAGGLRVEVRTLAERLGELPPRLLLMEVEGPIPDSLARAAAALARVVPRVAVLPGEEPRGHELVEAMLGEGLAVAEALGRLVRREGRPPERWPRVYGRSRPPMPPSDDRFSAFYNDRGWRLLLDRTDQTALALHGVKEARRGRRGAVIAWDGDADSGVERFLRRLDYELSEREDIPTAVWELDWPLECTVADLAARYEERLAVPPLDRRTTRAWDDALHARFRDRLGAADQGVVLIWHGVLLERWGPARVGARLLADYVAWFATELAPCFPEHLTPALLLGVEGGEAVLLELREDLAAPGWDGDAVELRIVPRLPSVNAAHVRKLINDRALVPNAADRDPVAQAIIAATQGRYEETVRAIEQLPWNWRTWRARYNARGGG